MKAAAGFMIMAAFIAFLACVAVKEQAPQPRMPVAEAHSPPCPRIDVCRYRECSQNGPRGGLDPDAGEKDNRRVA